MHVIHIQTKMQTIFGVLDDEGDVIEKVPVELELSRLNESVFIEAAKTLCESRIAIARKHQPAKVMEQGA